MLATSKRGQRSTLRTRAREEKTHRQREAGGGKADKEEGGRKKEVARVSGVHKRKGKGGKGAGARRGARTTSRDERGWARVGVWEWMRVV